METYFQAFVNFKLNNWARFLSMTKFTYNNAKNICISHILFELNCGYHHCISFKEDLDYRSRSMLAGELLLKLQKLMTVYCKNLFCIQELQKWAYDKGVKLKSYTLGDKIWLNNKYIKTKQNRKLKAKLFGLFWVLHPVKKQVYKLKKWRIHNFFHLLLLEQDITI